MEGHHFFGHGYHGPSHQPPPPSSVQAPPTVKIFCRSSENYCLAARDGQVVLAPANPRDPSQCWTKDTRHSTNVKDQEGYSAFALVNKATGEAIKNCLDKFDNVCLVPYYPDYPDESVLWSESRGVGNGFKRIRPVNNISLNLHAINGDKDHGGVHDGTTVVLCNRCKGDNQSWKIVPYRDEAVLDPVHASPVSHQAHGEQLQPIVKIHCSANGGFTMSAAEGAAVLWNSSHGDNQSWELEPKGDVSFFWNQSIGNKQGWKIKPGDEVVLNPVHASPVSHQAHGEESEPIVKIQCSANKGFTMSVAEGAAVLWNSSHGDDQSWELEPKGDKSFLWNQSRGNKQGWKIKPGDEVVLNPVHASPVSHQAHGGLTQPPVKIHCPANKGTVRNDTAVLAPANPNPLI